MFALEGGVFVNPADIVYIRPAPYKRSHVELRTGASFEDRRTTAQLVSDLRAATET